MDVRMPDGTIIRNVPDGTTKEQLQRKLNIRQLKIDNPGEFDPASKEFQAANGATSGNNFGQNLIAGVGQGIVNLGRKAGNIVGAYSDEKYADAKKLDASLMQTGGGKVGSFIGETAVSALPTLGVGAGLQAVGRGIQGIRGLATAGKIAANPVTRGVAEGAAQGALVADPNERGQGALIGGAFGGALPVLGAGIRKAATGAKRTPEAQTLLDAGVSLTPGQMNPRGMFNQAEEALQSAPFIGAPIKNARDGAMLDYNRAVLGRTVAPGAKAPAAQTLSGMVDEVDAGFTVAYDAAKGFPMRKVIMGAGVNEPLATALKKAVSNKSIFADDASRRAVDGFVTNQVTALGKTFDSGELLRVRSLVRGEKRAATVAGKTEVANLFQAAERKLTQALESQLPKDAVHALRATDAQYRKFVIPLKAAVKAKDRDSFTPTMHAQSIKETVSDRLFAMGGGDGRNLSKAGREVFDVKTPPTGARLGVLGAGAAGIYSNPMLAIPALSSVYGLAATGTGRKLAAGQTMTQKQVRDLLKKIQKDSRAQIANQTAQRSLVSAGTRE